MKLGTVIDTVAGMLCLASAFYLAFSGTAGMPTREWLIQGGAIMGYFAFARHVLPKLARGTP